MPVPEDPWVEVNYRCVVSVVIDYATREVRQVIMRSDGMMGDGMAGEQLDGVVGWNESLEVFDVWDGERARPWVEIAETVFADVDEVAVPFHVEA